jgi:hypothetical protein
MSAIETIMKRGFARKTPRHSEAKQKAALLAAGVEDRVIYVGDDDLDSFVRALRPGDEACVASLARFAPNRRILGDVIEAIHQKGAVIVEVETGRRSDDPPAQARMILDAADELAGDQRKLRRSDAIRYGKLGGKPFKQANMPDADAVAIWRNLDISSRDAADMIGLNYVTCYRRFGKRGAPAGRPPALKKLAFTDDASPKIYFLRAGDTDRIKIGWTAQWNGGSRVKGIGTGNHDQLHLIGVIDGRRPEEKHLHERYAEYRVRGEWFKLTGDLLKFVNALPPLPPSETERELRRRRRVVRRRVHIDKLAEKVAAKARK